MQLNFDRLLVLSFGFMLLFTAYDTAQSLAAQVLEDNNFGRLGFYSLALLYCVFTNCKKAWSKNVYGYWRFVLFYICGKFLTTFV